MKNTTDSKRGDSFAASPGSANNGESKWAWMMRWCREKGVSPANAAMWELAEKRWIEANSPNVSSSAATPGERSTDVR
jgi:hypothetical protein